MDSLHAIANRLTAGPFFCCLKYEQVSFIFYFYRMQTKFCWSVGLHMKSKKDTSMRKCILITKRIALT